MSKKFRLDMPDDVLEKEALYSFVVKVELHRPVTAGREALGKYYEIVIGFMRSAAAGVVEEIEGLDNDLYVLVLAGSKVVLWMRRVYICSVALFRRATQYIIGVKDRVERRAPLKKQRSGG
jgi:hypothetical protein